MSIEERIEGFLGSDLIVDYCDVYYWIGDYSISMNMIELFTCDNVGGMYDLEDVLNNGSFYKFCKTPENGV